MSEKRFDNNLQGVLFKRVKEKDSSPDYGGQCEIGGVEYWINAWINQAKAGGQKFMSLRFKIKEDRGQRFDEKGKAAQEPFNDEIPF